MVLYVQDSRRRLDVRDGVGKRLEKKRTIMKLIFRNITFAVFDQSRMSPGNKIILKLEKENHQSSHLAR